MNRVETVNDADFEILLSAVRDEQTDPDVLRSALRQLGEIAGLRIARKWFSSKRELMTPMRQPYLGIVQEDVNVCVVSTRDDFQHFGFGVASRFPGCLRGYLDLHGRRGIDALRSPIVSHQLPPKRGDVDAVIVAKSILATGCTAMRLLDATKKAYAPDRIIVTAVFHSQKGLREVLEANSVCEAVFFGEPDDLDGNGMLIPGVGNLDSRAGGKPLGWRDRLVRGFAVLLGVEWPMAG